MIGDEERLKAKSIFICYRRADSRVLLNFMYPKLCAGLSREALFRDVDDMPKGLDFREQIQIALEVSVSIILVIIGPNRLSIASPSGQRRIDNPEDHVRIEIETALQRPPAACHSSSRG